MIYTQSRLDLECTRSQSRFSLQRSRQKRSSLSSHLRSCHFQDINASGLLKMPEEKDIVWVFPDVFIELALRLTIPVINCNNEHLVSKLSLIANCLRSTLVGENRVLWPSCRSKGPAVDFSLRWIISESEKGQDSLRCYIWSCFRLRPLPLIWFCMYSKKQVAFCSLFVIKFESDTIAFSIVHQH